MTTQAISIPSMIPAQAIAPEILYIPLIRFGKVTHIPEIEIGRLREGELIADMLDAQITDVARVLAIDIVHSTSWDATRDIADAIFNHLIRSGSNVPEWLVDFLEANIGMNELAPYLRQLAA